MSATDPHAPSTFTTAVPIVSSVIATVSDATISNTNSSFLQLPAELRTQIYEYCLPQSGGARPIYRKAHQRPPPLLQACRQTRQETFAMYYSTGSFRTRSDEDLIRWVKAIGPEARALIRGLTIYSFDEWTPDLTAQKPRMLVRLRHLYTRLEEEGLSLPAGTLTAFIRLSDRTCRCMTEIEIEENLVIVRRKWLRYLG
ncbi:hypothetical protein CLAFUW4_11841 [Fulvia fulva]|nr:hypothetical protein CLAFUR4_11846 [Fulvia fulva]WPV18643.1 hypothetical protein CLAFUW4_11841 [Fulvia fulva]WPV33075.1 hypothetical protein CLAFUW7_11848 [Fulvia fulva]